MVKTNLAPGFRFHPTDVELVRYYLKRKVLGKKFQVNAIAEIDIYKFEPPDLPEKSCLGTGDLKWYFFCPREKKYPKGGKANRSTECGYWKTTGRDRDVLYNNEVVGKIRTLVYHFGKTPRSDRTDWVIHEYRLEDQVLAQKNVPQDSYVLCVLFKKNGLGPRHGSQYGAPYKDEDWSGDEEEDTQHLVAIPSAVNAGPCPGPSKETSLVATTSQSHAVKDCLTAGVISESCVSDVPPLTATVLPPLTSDVVGYAPMSSSPLLEVPHVPHDDDDELNSMLDLFSVVNDECLPFDDFDYPNGVRDEPDVYVNEEEAPVVLGDGNFSGMFDLSDEQVMEMEDLIQPPTPPSPDAQASNPDESRS
ncbi:PREDICTED: NAC domain-containing protein 82-like [Camelina sativa]|uniref:NAC domain-containing protein 82-like n=1 Tax=Camelina sativa TaxID=90675 RepID=A0ABM0UPY0_CAMSA|nr:PREDICTED: NAC domain-containing protein 82-like [Camelina sativa]XP_010444333.1 PREDICTED: NAC domain-containing protein 82-like [Camelina sativa]